MKIRPARPDEASRVSALATATFPMACPPGMLQTDIDAYASANLSEGRFAEHIAADDVAVLVADDDGLVGYTLVFFDDRARPEESFGVTVAPAGLLSKLYVCAERHGSGVAVALLDAAAAEAHRRGWAGLWLNANAVNLRAQRFYEKHGFTRRGYVDFVVGAAVHHDPVYDLRF